MEEARVGIFLSDCNGRISKILDFKDLIDYVKRIKDVAYVKQNNEFCSEAGIQIIKDAIPEKSLNRIVVSADEPITCMVKIRKAIQEVGLNPYLLERQALRLALSVNGVRRAAQSRCLGPRARPKMKRGRSTRTSAGNRLREVRQLTIIVAGTNPPSRRSW